MAFLENLSAFFKNRSAGSSEAHALIVGLGNPGAQYAETRHNAGFLAVDALAEQLDASSWRSQCDSLTTKLTTPVKGERIKLVLAKPQTMMNRSGRAIKSLLSYYDLSLDDVIVVHDDIDLPPGTLRVKQGGGHGGHNGIRNIIDTVGGDFCRVKIGVGEAPGRMDSARYVLQPLRGDALEELKVDAAQGALAAQSLLENGLTATQNRFN